MICANCGGIYIGKVVNLDDLCSCVTPAQQTVDSGEMMKCIECGEEKKPSEMTIFRSALICVQCSPTEPYSGENCDDCKHWVCICGVDEPAKPADGLVEQDDCVPSAEMLEATVDFFNKNLEVFSDAAREFDSGKIVAGIAKFTQSQIAQAIAADRIKRAEAPDDLIAEAREFIEQSGYCYRPTSGEPTLSWFMASFAQMILKRREGKVIDEFVERVEKRVVELQKVNPELSDWAAYEQAVALRVKIEHADK